MVSVLALGNGGDAVKVLVHGYLIGDLSLLNRISLDFPGGQDKYPLSVQGRSHIERRGLQVDGFEHRPLGSGLGALRKEGPACHCK